MDFALVLGDRRSRRKKRRREDQPDPNRRRKWGPWSDLVVELAGQDLDRVDRVLRWPIREALLVYLRRLQDQALEDYRFRRLEFCILAPHKKRPGKPPEVPEILKGF